MPLKLKIWQRLWIHSFKMRENVCTHTWDQNTMRRIVIRKSTVQNMTKKAIVFSRKCNACYCEMCYFIILCSAVKFILSFKKNSVLILFCHFHYHPFIWKGYCYIIMCIKYIVVYYRLAHKKYCSFLG